MTLERLRIFISSPGDVAEERVIANNLVRRLSDEFEQQLRIEPVFWEHEPLLATSTFQKQIPSPRDCDVAICILWSRIGTRLPADMIRRTDTSFGPAGSTYASGTEYEFEDAAMGFEQNGKPDLLVYRKTADPLVSIRDKAALMLKVEQSEALDVFIQRWFFNPDQTLKAAFHAFATTAEFAQVLEAHLRKLIARRLPEIDRSIPPAKPSWTKGSPFRGLQVFEFEHARVFCGRTRAVGDLLIALRASASAGKAFVLVVGVSGGGKSSLVRAGLLPLLVQPGVVEGIGLWRRAVLRPADSGDPMLSLAAAMLVSDALPELAADGTTAAQLAEQMRQNPGAAVALVKGALSQAASAVAREQGLASQPEARLALVADQLEELFTMANLSAADRQAFAAVLSALSRCGRVWVIATLRGDFYHRCLELPEIVALKEGAGQFDLCLPTGAETSQMIRQPAQAAGLSFEEDPATKVSLDEVLREAAASSPESLPLLEFALEELYQRRTNRGLLTYAAYRELGGVEGALAKGAEAVYAGLPPAVKATLPRVMRGLVRIRDGEGVARQQASVQTVAATPEAKVLVDAFVQARLFSVDRTGQGQAVVHVVHEALLRNWPRLVECLERDRELLIVRSRVSAAATRWIADGKPRDLLLGEGKPLTEAEKLLRAFGEELAPADRALIAASRARKRRRRVIFATVLCLLIAVGLVIRSKVIDQQNATTAAQLVKQVITADTAKVPAIIGEIAKYRRWADPLLRQQYSSAADDSQQKLRTSLALLPVDAGQVDLLYGQLLRAGPMEVPVIRDALAPHRQALVDRLWSVVETPGKGKESTRLRAAAALAAYAPNDKKWAAMAAPVAGDLVRENPVFLGQWSEHFRPVKNALLQPLGVIFRDTQPDRLAERNLAVNLLADYAADQPVVLADLLMDADEKQFAAIYPKFAAQAGKGLALLTAEIDRSLPMGSPDDARENLGKRQANAAVALLKLGQNDKVWPVFRHSADPRARSYLIHRLSPLGADPEAIIARLPYEPDLSIRRALILCLGEFNDQQLPQARRAELTVKLQEIYRTDPDAGLHAAVEWLLRAWNQEKWLSEVNERLANDDAQRLRQFGLLIATSKKPPAAPQWYVTSHGLSMVAIPGPVEFMMGSPPTDLTRDKDAREKDERLHKVRIGRSFAIAAKPVTFEQYRKFQPDYDLGIEPEYDLSKYSKSLSQPVNATTWYQAAAYCNWLSSQQKIPQDQWCYEISQTDLQIIKTGGPPAAIKLKKNYLSLSGYRLPTEAEIEYATRAGAVTSRYYGQTDELLPKYAWYVANSKETTWPVGMMKPNDLGFFDLHGNVWCWCQEEYDSYTTTANAYEVVQDEEKGLSVNSLNRRVLRGGSFYARASLLRCACRHCVVPTYRYYNTGFRPARTLPLVPLIPASPPAGGGSIVK